MTGPTRRTGAAALAAGTLLFCSVAAELVWPAQRTDGSLSRTPLFALYLTAWTLGAAALVVAVAGLRSPSRAGRIGRWTALAGAGLLLAFGLVVLGTALLTGAPAEASFLLFAVGLLVLAVGGVPLGLGLRSDGCPPAVWAAPLVAAAGALVALLAEADPWHDLGLFVFDLAWVALGLLTARAARVPQPGRVGEPRRTSPHS